MVNRTLVDGAKIDNRTGWHLEAEPAGSWICGRGRTIVEQVQSDD